MLETKKKKMLYYVTSAWIGSVFIKYQFQNDSFDFSCLLARNWIWREAPNMLKIECFSKSEQHEILIYIGKRLKIKPEIKKHMPVQSHCLPVCYTVYFTFL